MIEVTPGAPSFNAHCSSGRAVRSDVSVPALVEMQMTLPVIPCCRMQSDTARASSGSLLRRSSKMRVCVLRKRWSSSVSEGTVSLGWEAENALFSPQSLNCLMAVSVIASTRPLPVVVRSIVSSFITTGMPSAVRRISAWIAPAPGVDRCRKRGQRIFRCLTGTACGTNEQRRPGDCCYCQAQVAALLAAEAEGEMTMLAPEAAARISSVSAVSDG